MPLGTCVALDSIFIAAAYRLYVIMGRLGGVIRWIELSLLLYAAPSEENTAREPCASPLKDLRGDGRGDSRTKRKEPTLDE